MAHFLKRILQLPQKVSRICFQSPFVQRSISIGRGHFDNYEGDGKTTVTILNAEYKHIIMINSYSDMGFRLNLGVFVIGPIAVFPRTVMQWNVENITDLEPGSLSLFCLLEPKLDLLVLGTGDTKVLPSREVLEYLKENKINTEIMPTDQACSIFNFLNAEGRCVAGAFIPPQKVRVYEDEMQLLHTVDFIDDYTTSKSTRK